MYHRTVAQEEPWILPTGCIAMETALQRIIRKTGRRPVECRCRLCRQQCRIPCLGTPEDILRLLKAGYRERLAPTRWAVGLLLGKIPYIVPMVQAKQEAGGCTFFQDGLCELHAAGLKPTEGRLSHHTITMENLKFGMSLSWNVAKEWLDERNFDTIREIVRIMGK